MEIKTVSHRLTSLVVLYDMQTNFFSFALEGLSDNDAHNRLNTKANHIAWLAGSLVEQRYEMAKYFQADPSTYKATASAHELFGIKSAAISTITMTIPITNSAYLRIFIFC